ncbi:glycosyltransferase family 2 protein [Prevotella communis]|uniref:glycosyltransferase family 2 protein n=1 Tax=Prevotella communis TaxID=2913614 RepID=UPI000B88E5CB
MANLEIIVSIITINYNGVNDTCELIDSLPLEDKSIEVIVVDNASNEDEATIIANRYPQVKVIRSEINQGFAGGNNLGIKAARGKYLFFINNDAILKPQTSDLSHLISRFETDAMIGMVCPKICFAWGDNPIQFAGYTPLSRYTMRNRSIGFGDSDKGQYDNAHPTPYAHGAAMMVKREALEKVGLMPECYFLYYEELDWSMMFTRAGYSIWYEPACTIYHKESQATGQNSPLKTYYLTHNRLLFVKRNIQGLRRYITYTYLLLAVAPRDICRYILHRQFNLASATIKGIKKFILEK